MNRFRESGRRYAGQSTLTCACLRLHTVKSHSNSRYVQRTTGAYCIKIQQLVRCNENAPSVSDIILISSTITPFRTALKFQGKTTSSVISLSVLVNHLSHWCYSGVEESTFHFHTSFERYSTAILGKSPEFGVVEERTLHSDINFESYLTVIFGKPPELWDFS